VCDVWQTGLTTDDSHDAPESVTSAEFDRFLSERVREAEHMPNVGSSAVPRSDVAQTGQPQTGGELFSL